MSARLISITVTIILLSACKVGTQAQDAGPSFDAASDLDMAPDMIVIQDMVPFFDFGYCYGKGTGHHCATDIDCGGLLHCHEGMCCNGEFHEEDCSCRCNGQICNAYDESCCAADPGWKLQDGNDVKCRPSDQCYPPWGPVQ